MSECAGDSRCSSDGNEGDVADGQILSLCISDGEFMWRCRIEAGLVKQRGGLRPERFSIEYGQRAIQCDVVKPGRDVTESHDGDPTS